MKYYVKFYASNEQGQSEILANSIYNTLKLGAPDSFQVELDSKPGVASVVIPSLEPTTISQLKNTSNENTVKAGFVADAFLANWDVVGLTSDNIFKNPSTLDYVRIDNGGSMFFRAQGASKSYGPVVNELESMRNPDTAKQAGKVFQGLTDGDLKPQAKELTSILTDDKIKELVAKAGFEGAKADKYEKVLQERRDDIASTLLGKNKPPDEPKPELKQEEPTKPTTGGKQLAAKYTKDKDPSMVAGYFMPKSAKGLLYKSLEEAKGDWVKVADLKAKHAEAIPDVDKRLRALKRWGKNTGDWSVEQSGDQVRMFVTDKSKGSIKPQTNEQIEKSEGLAGELAHKIVTGQLGEGSPEALYDNYFKQAGVSVESKKGCYAAIRSWTYTVNEAQELRKVAMDYYGRSPSGEHTDGYANQFKDPESLKALSEKANAVKDAALALKSLTGAVAKEQGITTLYRGITGKVANEIVQDIKTKGYADVPVNSLSSWSSSKSEAKSFGSILLKLKVDPDNLWASHKATPWLFYGHDEKEYIVGFHQEKEKFLASDIEKGSHY